MTTPCGANYSHDWHIFTDADGSKQICDGVIREEKL